MAVDGTELFRDLLSLVDNIVQRHVILAVGSIRLATLGDNLAVVVGTTSVPGKELKNVSIFLFLFSSRGNGLRGRNLR